MHEKPINIERKKANFLSPHCSSRKVLDILADKWALLAISAISRGINRNGAIMREIGDISQKMLTQTLRSLEYNGIISRTVHDGLPLRVDYALTPLGSSLIPVIQFMGQWVETHYIEVEEANALHDQQRADVG